MIHPLKQNLLIVAVAGIAGSCAVHHVDPVQAHEEFRRRSHQIKDAGLACWIYADKHAGCAPDNLEQLAEVYGRSSFFTRVKAELELVAPGVDLMHAPDNHWETPLLREKHADAKGRRIFVYLNGAAMLKMADGSEVPRELWERLTP